MPASPPPEGADPPEGQAPDADDLTHPHIDDGGWSRRRFRPLGTLAPGGHPQGGHPPGPTPGPLPTGGFAPAPSPDPPGWSAARIAWWSGVAVLGGGVLGGVLAVISLGAPG